MQKHVLSADHWQNEQVRVRKETAGRYLVPMSSPDSSCWCWKAALSAAECLLSAHALWNLGREDEAQRQVSMWGGVCLSVCRIYSSVFLCLSLGVQNSWGGNLLSVSSEIFIVRAGSLTSCADTSTLSTLIFISSSAPALYPWAPRVCCSLHRVLATVTTRRNPQHSALTFSHWGE